MLSDIRAFTKHFFGGGSKSGFPWGGDGGLPLSWKKSGENGKFLDHPNEFGVGG
jgi:hypothetical protein